jgi:hypothetical protein
MAHHHDAKSTSMAGIGGDGNGSGGAKRSSRSSSAATTTEYSLFRSMDMSYVQLLMRHDIAAATLSQLGRGFKQFHFVNVRKSSA